MPYVLCVFSCWCLREIQICDLHVPCYPISPQTPKTRSIITRHDFQVISHDFCLHPYHMWQACAREKIHLSPTRLTVVSWSRFFEFLAHMYHSRDHTQCRRIPTCGVGMLVSFNIQLIRENAHVSYSLGPNVHAWIFGIPLMNSRFTVSTRTGVNTAKYYPGLARVGRMGDTMWQEEDSYSLDSDSLTNSHGFLHSNPSSFGSRINSSEQFQIFPNFQYVLKLLSDETILTRWGISLGCTFSFFCVFYLVTVLSHVTSLDSLSTYFWQSLRIGSFHPFCVSRFRIQSSFWMCGHLTH